MTHLQAAADLTTAAKRQFEFVIQSDLTAYGDTRLLEIALTNLLENASKLTGSKSVVRIEFSQTVANGQPAYFARDNGVDFEPAYTRNLSGAFQRLHSLANLPAQVLAWRRCSA